MKKKKKQGRKEEESEKQKQKASMGSIKEAAMHGNRLWQNDAKYGAAASSKPNMKERKISKEKTIKKTVWGTMSNLILSIKISSENRWQEAG